MVCKIKQYKLNLESFKKALNNENNNFLLKTSV